MFHSFSPACMTPPDLLKGGIQARSPEFVLLICQPETHASLVFCDDPLVNQTTKLHGKPPCALEKLTIYYLYTAGYIKLAIEAMAQNRGFDELKDGGIHS